MYKNMFVMMSYATFTKWMLLAMASGALTVASWWMMDKWLDAYNEARENGAVA